MIRKSARNDPSAGSFRFDDGAKSLGDVIRKVQQQEQPPLERPTRPLEASEIDRVRGRVQAMLKNERRGDYERGWVDASYYILQIIDKKK